MKSTIASSALLAFLASVSATPSSMRSSIKRQIGAPGVGPVCTSTTAPSDQDVLNALNIWDADVKNVNNFLDIASIVVSNPTQLEVLATGALNNAKDEPTELGILACIAGLDDASEDAINSAAAGFGNNVIDTLTDISVNGANTSQVQAEIRQINTFRCCTLLPGLDALWLSAAENAGLVGQVALSPPRPNACGSGDIICP